MSLKCLNEMKEGNEVVLMAQNTFSFHSFTTRHYFLSMYLLLMLSTYLYFVLRPIPKQFRGIFPNEEARTSDGEVFYLDT